MRISLLYLFRAPGARLGSLRAIEVSDQSHVYANALYRDRSAARGWNRHPHRYRAVRRVAIAELSIAVGSPTVQVALPAQTAGV